MMVFEAFLSQEEIRQRQVAEQMSNKVQKRTPEQIEAIYTNGHNVLVSASAGSGKTFVMVERILDKLERGVKIEELFISTFTVKAAGELKDRIEKKLKERIAKLGTNHPQLRSHLVSQLDSLSTADIGTMDAFTQKLVVTYGYSLGISPQFRILQDETEKLTLKKEVFHQLFHRFMEQDRDDRFRLLVRNFSGKRKDNSGFREVVYQIHDFSQSTSNPMEWLQTKAVQIENYRTTGLEKKLAEDCRGDLLEILEEVRGFFQHHIEWGKEEFGSAKYFPNVEAVLGLSSLANDATTEQLFDTIQQILRINDQSNGRGLTNSNRPKDAHLIAFKEEYNAGKNQLIAHLKEKQREIYEWKVIKDYQEQAIPLLELLQDFVVQFAQAYLAAKMQEAAFEFSDIGHFAIRILEENHEVRQYFQEKYHEVMVDEYQDNNHSQEKMLELLSNGHNRFMVGDIKQSIYRFRQADPSIFQAKFEQYQEETSDGQLILLKENFRSQIEVLEATNAIFTRLMDKEIGEIRYDKTHCLVAGSPKQTEQQTENQMEYILYDDSEKSEEDGEDSPLTAGEIAIVAKEIIRLHNEKGVSFKDITLLVQSRTKNDLIQAIFNQHGIPLVADGGAGSYLTSLEVMILLDTLRVINNPLNDYALVALLKSPMFQFNEDELARISLQSQQGFFYDKMKGKDSTSLDPKTSSLLQPALKKKIADFLERLQDWRLFAKRHSIHDLIWKIFNEKFYYDYVSALPNGKKRQANLYALGLRANQFEQTGYKGLGRFIAMIDRTLTNEKDLADVQEFLPEDAVQLMTIHKSKGLEFKYVFLMNSDKRFNMGDQRQSVIISREKGIGVQYLADMKDRVNSPLPHVRVLMDTLPYQENLKELKRANLSEQMRLLYVALTRAEKKLYVVGKGQKEKIDQQYDGKQEGGLLARESREKMSSFQDWILGIQAAFPNDALHFHTVFVTDEELTTDKIGQLHLKHKLEESSPKHLRQSEDIKAAIEQLSSVQALNVRYKSAIELPRLRTPSQIKKRYESILEQEGLEIMDKQHKPSPSFTLPDFSKKVRVTGAQIGSVVHELMQRLDLSWLVTEDTVKTALQAIHAEDEVKDKVPIQKIIAFFDTHLGQEISSNTDKLHREAPFASLQRDSASNEQFVLRGIIDGYLLYEDHIVLFDYKTDRYSKPSQMRERYQGQMELYAEALKKAYSIDRVDCYLILLGGDEVEVLAVDVKK